MRGMKQVFVTGASFSLPFKDQNNMYEKTDLSLPSAFFDFYGCAARLCGSTAQGYKRKARWQATAAIGEIQSK
jgi:hypothetical protein